MLLTCSFQIHKNQILLLKRKQILTLPTTLGSPALPGEQALNLALYFLQLLGERGLLWESPVTAGSAGCSCSRAPIKAKLPESSACSGISLRGNSEWGVPPRADLGPGRTGKLQLLEPSPALDIPAGHSPPSAKASLPPGFTGDWIPSCLWDTSCGQRGSSAQAGRSPRSLGGAGRTDLPMANPTAAGTTPHAEQASSQDHPAPNFCPWLH